MSDNSLTNTLVDELRAAVNSGKGNYGHRLLCGNAAEEIERLQKLNTALLDATEGCVNCSVKLHQWMRAGGVTAPEPKADYQAPIAKVTVPNLGGPVVSLYAPGLPPGDHDLYCEPPADDADDIQSELLALRPYRVMVEAVDKTLGDGWTRKLASHFGYVTAEKSGGGL